MNRFSEALRRYQTDKDTNHSYGPVYDKIFPAPEAVRSVLEVGIASGGCLLAWRDIFPNAWIVGFDLEPCHRAEMGSEDDAIFPLCARPSRIEIHQGDLRSHADLMRAVNGRQFDFICEDATHLLEDNLACFRSLWPHVAPGGVYVAEEWCDIHASRTMLEGMGAELWVTGPPIEGELLAVWRKPYE